jgi:hypothetical protein
VLEARARLKRKSEQHRKAKGQRSTPVMLGEESDVALLGTVTLEELGLVLNPLTRQLQAMQMLFA